VTHQGRHQVIVCGTKRVRAYDLNDGKVIWQCGGLSANVVATPLAADGMVYVGSSYEIRSMFAIQLDGAAGDITGSKNVVWSRRDRTPYVPSPILYGDSLYFLRHYQGILTRVNARTGEEGAGPLRLGALRNVYSSPVGAANRIYVTDLEGTTQVISHGEIPRTLAVNSLDDSFSASAAIVGDEILLRGNRFLYCIATASE
jgi:outer membrane protein assembly factor BamB